jgi:hypothetical protein
MCGKGVMVACGFAVLVTAGHPARGDNPWKTSADVEDRVQKVLEEWARVNERTRPMRYTFRRTDKDPTFGIKTVWRGKVLYKQPDILRVDLLDAKGKKEGSAVFTEKRIHLYRFNPGQTVSLSLPEDRTFMGRKTRHHTGWGGLVESVSRSLRQQYFYFYAGLPALELPELFDIELKEDRHYRYLTLRPRRKEDKAYFTRLRVVLQRATYRTRQLWMESADGSETTIDFDPPDTKGPPVTTKELFRGLPE